MEEQGKVCTKCGKWKPLEEYHKNKNSKDGKISRCKECINQLYQNQKEIIKEKGERYRKLNKERLKERSKRYREANKEYIKEYREANKERMKIYKKEMRKKQKKKNLQEITNLVEQISPIFKQLNLPIYGYIYKFENIKTGHKYLGQSIIPLKDRYKSNVIQGWIEHRKSFKNQKFIDELIEEDIEVTEILDVACCKYHLDKLETYYINYYDSCNNGYNIEAGNHITDYGLEEFQQILKENGLRFVDGKLIAI